MADKKISEMTAASAYTGTNEFYEMVQGGNTRQGSHALLKRHALCAGFKQVVRDTFAVAPTQNYLLHEQKHRHKRRRLDHRK
jgi:hypothetical protein